MKKAGFLLKTDGTMTPVSAKDQRGGFTIKELYALIGNGCNIVERIALPNKREMWLDEEGKLRAVTPPINPIATKLLASAGGIPGDYVVGNVVILE